jgi:hypothetical protein
MPSELAPGLWHWTALHPRIHIEVSSYLLVPAGVLIDPLPPSGGLDWLAFAGPPRAILLTNRHHYRGSSEIAARFGIPVRCAATGLHEFRHGEAVEPFAFGDILEGGIEAHRVGAICPDETALYAPSHRALAVADGVVRMPSNGPLTFVPDHLIGDDPATVKRELRAAYRRLAELDFDHLLLAHGLPIVGAGRKELRTFASAS